MQKKEIRQAFLTGERALFMARDMRLVDCIFDEGESPLKHSSHMELTGCMFRWKYPLWYAAHIHAQNCTWFEMARAGVWYSTDVTVDGAVIEAPKNFRRCKGLVLRDVALPNAAETLWNCSDVTLERVTAKGDYFGMGCENGKLSDFTLVGNYSFDGAKNLEVRNARMLSKDAFWNTENVTVYDSFISGEYLGWNARNLRLVNCTVESLQGLCYIENLTMENCKLINTTLSFEYSTDIHAEIESKIDSVFNPAGGYIHAPAVGELILELDKIDPSKTQIVLEREPDKRTDRVVNPNTEAILRGVESHV